VQRRKMRDRRGSSFRMESKPPPPRWRRDHDGNLYRALTRAEQEKLQEARSRGRLAHLERPLKKQPQSSR
jgi:hypothetical protein